MKNNVTVQAVSTFDLIINNDQYDNIKNFKLISLEKDVVLFINSKPESTYEVKKVFNIVIDGDVKDIKIDSTAKINLTCQDVDGNITLSSGSVNCMDVGGDVTVSDGSLNCIDIDGDVTATNCKVNAVTISKLTKN